MSLEFKDLLDYCQAEAISGKFSPTEDSVYRSLCRTYSKKFHTPLHTVLALPVTDVVLAVYEEQLEDLDMDKFENLEQVHETILAILDPNYEAHKETKLEQDIAAYEREEEERIAAGRLVHPSLARKATEKTLPENGTPDGKNLPTGGHINMSYLEDEEN